MICKFPLPLLSLRTVNTVTHCYDTSAVLPQLLLDKDRQKASRLFIRGQFLFFPLLLVPNFMSKLSGGRNFQASAQTLFDIRLRPNSLKFSSSRFLRYPNIRTYKVLCSGTDIKQTAKTNSYVLGRNVSQHQTSCMLLCIILQLHVFHTFQWISGLFLCPL